MNAPGQRMHRIVGALEDLAAQEATAMAQSDFDALASIQDRLAALVTDLAENAAQLRDPSLQKRVKAVYELRTQTSELLEATMGRARTELRETEMARRTTARIAPAYGAKPASLVPKLSFVG